MSAFKAETFELDDDEIDDVKILTCRCQQTIMFVHEDTGIIECAMCGRTSDKFMLVRKH